MGLLMTNDLASMWKEESTSNLLVRNMLGEPEEKQKTVQSG
jgi:hypothetical protein